MWISWWVGNYAVPPRLPDIVLPNTGLDSKGDEEIHKKAWLPPVKIYYAEPSLVILNVTPVACIFH